MTTVNNVKTGIRSYIEEYMLFGGSIDGDDMSLLKSGAVDSLGAVELSTFLSKQFDVKIDISEVSPDNLDTVNLITKFVVGKMLCQAA